MMFTFRQFSAVRWLAVVLLSFNWADVAESKKIDGAHLLDPDRLVEVRIELPKDDWRQLCRQSRNPAAAFSGLPSVSPYTYFKANIWIDGVKIESVGVRKKGFFGSADTQPPSLLSPCSACLAAKISVARMIT